MKLFNIATSGNCHRVRLMLSLLGLSAEIVEMDHKAGALHTPEFLAINPLGEVPVLQDGTLIQRDSCAILVYLARRYGKPAWLPDDAESAAAIQQWLSIAANEIQNGPRMARAIVLGIVPGDLTARQAATRRLFTEMDRILREREWLAGASATIADVACYPYVWNAGDGGIAMNDYAHLLAWLRRVEALPGFVAMTRA